jgi:hypothetical protein
MVLNDWMILNIDIEGLRKELIMAYLKVLALALGSSEGNQDLMGPHLDTCQVRDVNHLNWWLQ